MWKMNCEDLQCLSRLFSKETNRTKQRIVLRLGCSNLDEIYGAGRGCRTVTIENIGEDWRKAKMQNYVFAPEPAYLLGNNKTGGTKNSSPALYYTCRPSCGVRVRRRRKEKHKLVSIDTSWYIVFAMKGTYLCGVMHTFVVMCHPSFAKVHLFFNLTRPPTWCSNSVFDCDLVVCAHPLTVGFYPFLVCSNLFFVFHTSFVNVKLHLRNS